MKRQTRRNSRTQSHRPKGCKLMVAGLPKGNIVMNQYCFTHDTFAQMKISFNKLKIFPINPVKKLNNWRIF